MSLVELKAIAFDISVNMDRGRQELEALSKLIASKVEQESKLPEVKPDPKKEETKEEKK